MKLACAKFGGTEVTKRATAPGYLNKNTLMECLYCFLEIGSVRFQYVDIIVDERQSVAVSGVTGVFRFEAVDAPDARCKWWNSSLSRKNARIYGIAEDQCVALYPVDKKSAARFESDVTRHQLIDGPFGIDLFKDEHVIVDQESGDRMASQRNFKFVTPLARALGGTQPRWECDSEANNPFDPTALRARVLTKQEVVVQGKEHGTTGF